MPTITAIGAGGFPDTVRLAAAQVGNGPSGNVLDRLGGTGEPSLLEIATTVGATPTVTINVEGSVDGTTWWNVPYSEVATPQTFAVAALVITTATTRRLILPKDIPWRFLRLVMSANTNVTVTADVTVF